MEPIIRCQDVSKAFPGVQALDGISMDVEKATCHGLIGENGAGKSTLGKILAGLYEPDSGKVLIEGQPVRFRSPSDAARAGIGIVHQELLFCENLSVSENLNLHEPPSTAGFYRFQSARDRAVAALKAIGADVDPDQRVEELTVAKQQLVQIAGAIALGAKILIFDEPTSSLSQSDANRLLALIDKLKVQGVTCIYVSHRLDEVFRICDHVTVLRDGKLICTVATKDVDRHTLVEKMVGRELNLSSAVQAPVGDAPEILKVEKLTVPGRVHELSFSVRGGEIVGFAGLVGAGRTEALEALFGLGSRVTGSFVLKGREYQPASPSHALQQGVGLIPEDRKRHGLVLTMTAKENISLPLLDDLSSAGFLKGGEERNLAEQYFERLRVKAPSVDARAEGLSGGNQQKLVLAKWVAAKCDVLLVDEPTRGVDIGAKAEIHGLLRELAGQRKAIVLASSELPELLALCSRILVLRDGRLVREIFAADADENKIMRMMAGVAIA